LTYNKKNILLNEIATTEEMLDRPTLKWDTHIGALYTIILVDFGIERLQGQQYIHWLVQWGLSRDGELVKKYSQKPNY
jgi:hypothetical protein